MRVIVNGATREIAAGMSVTDLLVALDLAQAPVAVVTVSAGNRW